MPEARPVRFGNYTLHPTEGLVRGRRHVHVTQKSLVVLHVLVQRAGQVVTKDELFRLAWPDTAVSDAALTSCIQELRRALQDDAKKPSYIETLHRRGFRFIRPPTSLFPAPVTDAPGRAAGSLVGRNVPLGQLATAFAAAETGRRQTILVTGEAGIGKTSLVEHFVDDVADRPGLQWTRGDAVERLGASEAYQALLDAFTRLCRRPHGGRFITTLRQVAPAWLAELPVLQSAASVRALQRRTAGATHGRMLRELNDALETLAGEETLLLWLEDIHWADASTLDWLTACAARPERAKLLLVATARLGVAPRLDALCAALRLKPGFHHVALTGVDEAAIRELIAHRAGESETWQSRLAARVHARTEGHPLFVRAVLDDLVARGWPLGDSSVMRAEELPVLPEVPEGLTELIERQFDALSADERALLEAASVLDEPAWSAALVAACTHRSAFDAEHVLAALSRRGAFLRHTGKIGWPDGTIAASFAFLHVLHRDVLRQRLTAGHRAELHRHAAARLERAFATETHVVAAQLAVHLEEGQELGRAVTYLQAAGQNATRRGAVQEARQNLERALAVLDRTEHGAPHDEREAQLQVLLGGVMMAADGWGAPAAERAFDRARALCAGLEKTPQLFPSYWGIWLYRWGRADLASARALASSLDDLLDGGGPPLLRLQAHHAQWATAFSLGDLDAVVAHGDAGYALCQGTPDSDQLTMYGNHDAGVCSRAFAGRALAAQGRLRDATHASEDAVRRARRLGHPFTLSLALVFQAATHQTARNAARTADEAAEAAAIGAEQGYRLLHAWAVALESWARGALGSPERALPQLRDAVRSALDTGSRQFQTFLMGLLAETSLAAGQIGAGLATVDEALASAASSGERFFEPELLRVRGALLRAAPGGERNPQAQACLQAALSAAHRQGAHLFALRAALDLAGSARARGPRDADRTLVREALDALAADASSPDLDAARAFLES